MNRFRARILCGGNDFFPTQITLARGRRADKIRFVRHPHVKRVFIGCRINRDGFDIHITAGANDAAGDFSAIGY